MHDRARILNKTMAVLLAAIITLPVCARAAINDNSPVTSIREFLQNRPPVSKIAFQVIDFTSASISSNALPRVGKVSKNFQPMTNSAFFQGGCTTNAFFMREVFTKEEAMGPVSFKTKSGPRFSGGEGDKFWRIAPDNNLYETQIKQGESPNSNPTAVNSLTHKLILDRVLNLGIERMKPGTAVWEGDRFTAKFEDGIIKLKSAYRVENGQRVQILDPKIYGKVVQENERVTGIRINNSCTNGQQFFLQYEYDPKQPLPCSMPNRIRRSIVTGEGHLLPIEEINIFTFETATPSNLVPALSLHQYIHTPGFRHFVESNHQYFEYNNKGNLTELGKVVPFKALSPSVQRARQGTLIVVFTFITLASIGLGWRVNKNTTANKKI